MKSCLAVLLLMAPLSFGRSGPQHRSLRPLSMGNAFVAVVDDKDALYYNPAGLNLINSLGSSGRPNMGPYPRDRMDLRVDVVGNTMPLQDIPDFLNFYDHHKDSFSSKDKALSDTSFAEDATPFDRKPVEIGVMHGAVFAMHNFGFAYWADARAAPYPDEGIVIPQAGVQKIEVDAMIQIAGARSFMNNRLAVGVGYRLANRQTIENYQISAEDFANGDKLPSSIRDTLLEKLDNVGDPSS